MVARVAQRAVTAGRRGRAWCRSGSNLWLLGAVATGFVLRLAWVVWTTRAPSHPFSDPAQYQSIAEQLVDGHSPAIGGFATAFWPPGWPMALVPLAWFTSTTGWLSLPFAASLLNVAAGTGTVALTAALAGRWIGPTARVPAAWLMAIAPTQVYFSSTLVSETWFTFVLLLTFWLLTIVLDGDRHVGRLVAIGLLVGYAMLVRTPGIALLAVPALSVRALDRNWRGTLRPTLALALGALVVLVPWTVRNGAQVGVWTPLSTNNAAFSCIGLGDDATGGNDESEATTKRCYRHSPWDNRELVGDTVPWAGTPDEPRWYRTTLTDTLSWSVRRPLDVARLAAYKTYLTLGSSQDGLVRAEDAGAQPIVGGIPRDLLSRVADAWQWIVLALGALGLAFVPACRRAVPVWGLIVLQIAMIWGGIGMDRYNHPIMPLVVLFAAGAIATLRSGRAPQPEPTTAPSDVQDASTGATSPVAE